MVVPRNNPAASFPSSFPTLAMPTSAAANYPGLIQTQLLNICQGLSAKATDKSYRKSVRASPLWAGGSTLPPPACITAPCLDSGMFRQSKALFCCVLAGCGKVSQVHSCTGGQPITRENKFHPSPAFLKPWLSPEESGSNSSILMYCRQHSGVFNRDQGSLCFDLQLHHYEHESKLMRAATN